MKRVLVLVLVFCMLFTTVAFAAKKEDVNTITQGEVYYKDGHYLEGEAIPTGFDMFGYNYQGHFFKGYYFNVYAGGEGYSPYMGDSEAYLDKHPLAEDHWAWPFRDTFIEMKWNDAWLSNVDRDLDGELDRNYGHDSYIGSGAWEKYYEYTLDEFGEIDYEYFCKIIAAPETAYKEDGYWYSEDDVELGYDIWGQFFVTQEYSTEEEWNYVSPARNGLGNW